MGADVARVLLLWDVDHTLIENGGVSKENYALAFEILTGRVPGAEPRTDGRTDRGIMAGLLSANGEDPAAYPLERQWDALVESASRKSAELARRGYALPGAAEALRRLSGAPGIYQSVLTGNIRPNAVVKLRAFGLDRWIDWEIGGYGWDSPDRARLVAAAQGRAAGCLGFSVGRDVTVLVGDTTLDVRAGTDGGARVIGVATGTFSRGELAAAGADVVLDDLADTDAFVAALSTARAAGPVPSRLQPAESRG
jgi:phosphoglycolate phosphatase